MEHGPASADFEVLEHTADIGLLARGRTLPKLFAHAAEAVAWLAIETAEVRESQAYPLEARGEDREALLVNWLSEALYLLDGANLALRRFETTSFEDGRVAGQAWGEPWDPQRHRPRLVVKGITYHQLRIEPTEGGWEARVFLDI